MTEIGLLPNLRAAQALVDYLKGQGITCQVEPVPEGILLAVLNPNDTEIAEKTLDHFLAHPNDPRYLQASWEHGDVRNRIEYAASSTPIIKQFFQQSGPLTLSIFVLCVVIFTLMNVGYANDIYQSLSYFGAVGNGAISVQQYGDLWRFFTPSLLHFSLLHITFNLLWWWYFGGKIEKHISWTSLLILLLVAGTLPNLAQAYFSGPNFGGLSGVVYGLIAYVWVMQQQRPDKGLFMPPALMVMTVLWMILGFAQMLPIPVANSAHLGGFIIGLAQGWVDSRRA